MYGCLPYIAIELITQLTLLPHFAKYCHHLLFGIRNHLTPLGIGFGWYNFSKTTLLNQYGLLEKSFVTYALAIFNPSHIEMNRCGH